MVKQISVLTILSFFFLAPATLAQPDELPADLEIIPEELAAPAPDSANPPAEEFYRGEVTEIIEEYQDEFGLGGTRPFIQQVKVRITTGSRTGEEATVEYGTLLADQKLEVRQKVVLIAPNETIYVFDHYRLPALGGILLLFIGLAVVFAGWRGLTSLVGLGVSVLVLIWYIVPQIMGGASPLVVSLIGALVIALISIYLAHGFNRRTTVAVASTLITVVFAIGLAQLFVNWAALTGSGSEEAFKLQTSPIAFVNLKGLLLGGIIIGALGVLDDITTSQAAAVQEIWRANPTLTPRELFKRGTSVGKEHITSLINTLALAYVGASFPALLLFTVYQRPWWVVANTEAIAEEIIRTLVGSSALMIAVPITTALAAYFLSKGPLPAENEPPLHPHSRAS